MHAQHALTSAPPTRSWRWRALLSLSLGILFGSLCMCAIANAGTGTNSGLPGPGDYSPRSTSMGEPRLVQQDQQGTGTSSGGTTGSDYTWMPFTRRSYVGLNLGTSDYDTPCGPAPLSCDRHGRSVSIYTGGMFSDFLGLELGLRHFGKVERAGGQVRSYGAAASLVGMVDMDSFSAHAKLGAQYGRTRLTADPIADIATGSATGWGPSLAVGVGFNFNRNYTLTLERSRDRFRLPGGSHAYVQSTSLGLRYRF